MILIESVKSLRLEMYFGETLLAKGTCFLVQRGMQTFLVTNRHNVTGRDQATNQPLSTNGGVPDRVIVWHRVKADPGAVGWKSFCYMIYNGQEAGWYQHPVLGSRMDVVALPIIPSAEIMIDNYSLETPEQEVLIEPTDTVSVIGFPFGLSGGARLAIWTTGSVASEYTIDFDDLPVFLVDARTRVGQSGSPVVAYRTGSVRFTNGSVATGQVRMSEFLGVYSGRVNADSDLGKVWKRQAIKELVDAAP